VWVTLGVGKNSFAMSSNCAERRKGGFSQTTSTTDDRQGRGQVDAGIFNRSRRKAMMHYKGYGCTIRFDEEADIFHGEVTGLRDVVTFQGRTVDEGKSAFRESIDDYLDFCASRGETPDKPYSGRFLL